MPEPDPRADPAADVRDLSASAATLRVLAAAVAAGPPVAAALLAVAQQVVGMAAAASAAPTAVVADPEWGAAIDSDGLVISGPDMDILVDGPPGATRRIQVMAGGRTLMVAPSATETATNPDALIGVGGMRVRLLDGASAVVDTSFPVAGAARNHLDFVAVASRVAEVGREAAARMPPAPFEERATAPGGLAGGAVPGGGMPAASGAVDAPAAIGILAGSAAAAAMVATALRQTHGSAAEPPVAASPSPVSSAAPSPVPAAVAWLPTHAIAPGSPVAIRSRPNPAEPAGSINPGVEVRLLALDGGWALVGAPNGWQAWLDARALVRLDRPEEAFRAWSATHVIIGGGPVPVAARPDPAAAAGFIPPGVPVRLLALDRGWARVDAASGAWGWIDAQRLGLLR